jgi:hypothetical protein
MPVKFSVPDPFGNPITLHLNTWDVHIVPEHKEMAPHLRAVENTIRNPTFIYESSISDTHLIFHGHNLLTPDPKIIRAVIKYPGILNIDEVLGGSVAGLVTTAFVLRPENEFTGNVSTEIYKRAAKAKKKK